MAATEHEFSQRPLPRILALDADFIVSVIVESEPFHRPCADFAARLVRENIVVVHSPLLRFEVLRAWQKAIGSDALPRRVLPQRSLWVDPVDERSVSWKLANDLLDEFLDLFRQLEGPPDEENPAADLAGNGQGSAQTDGRLSRRLREPGWDIAHRLAGQRLPPG